MVAFDYFVCVIAVKVSVRVKVSGEFGLPAYASSSFSFVSSCGFRWSCCLSGLKYFSSLSRIPRVYFWMPFS